MILNSGDIAACFGVNRTSRLISLGTFSLLAPSYLKFGPSHVAMICQRHKETFWVESTTLCPRACRIRKQLVAGVQAHHPEDRISDYISAGGRVDIYRLTKIDSLSQAEADLLSRILLDHFVARAVRYDIGGALLSGTRVFQLLHSFPLANLDELFCSEMVAAVLMRLGRMNRDNPTRFNPGRLLRTVVRHGTYRRIASLRKSFA